MERGRERERETMMLEQGRSLRWSFVILIVKLLEPRKSLRLRKMPNIG